MRSINRILWIFFAQNWPNIIRNKLQEDIDWECDERDQQAIEPLVASETIHMNGHKSSKVLGAENLDDDNDGPNDDEGRVSGDTIEDIQLVVNLSRANHVENLHENEQIENNGQMSGWCFRLKCFVHGLAFSVFHHTKDHIELASVPVIFKSFIEGWIAIFRIQKLFFNRLEIQLLCSS